MHRKKYQIAINLVAAIWIAAFAQILINECFQKESAFIEAFTTGGNETVKSHLDVTASYGDAVLTETEKEDLLKYLAAGVGLTKGYKLEGMKGDGLRLTKNGSQAETLISFVASEEDDKQYIHFQLDLWKNPNQITHFKSKVEDCLRSIDAKEWQTTMGLQSAYEGRLGKEQIENLAAQMLKSLKAKTISEYSEDGMYSVYAYTESVKESVLVDGERINVHIVARYQESEDRTLIQYSTPIVNEDF